MTCSFIAVILPLWGFFGNGTVDFRPTLVCGMNTDFTQTWQSAPVFRSRDFFVSEGINIGQPILGAQDLCTGDIYRLTKDARSYRLNAFETPDRPLIVSQSTMLGLPGNDLHFDCCLTFISECGVGFEICLILEVDKEDRIVDYYYLPKTPIPPGGDYELICIKKMTAPGPGLPMPDQHITEGFAAVHAARGSEMRDQTPAGSNGDHGHWPNHS